MRDRDGLPVAADIYGYAQRSQAIGAVLERTLNPEEAHQHYQRNRKYGETKCRLESKGGENCSLTWPLEVEYIGNKMILFDVDPQTCHDGGNKACLPMSELSYPVLYHPLMEGMTTDPMFLAATDMHMKGAYRERLRDANGVMEVVVRLQKAGLHTMKLRVCPGTCNPTPGREDNELTWQVEVNGTCAHGLKPDDKADCRCLPGYQRGDSDYTCAPCPINQVKTTLSGEVNEQCQPCKDLVDDVIGEDLDPNRIITRPPPQDGSPGATSIADCLCSKGLYLAADVDYNNTKDRDFVPPRSLHAVCPHPLEDLFFDQPGRAKSLSRELARIFFGHQALGGNSASGANGMGPRSTWNYSDACGYDSESFGPSNAKARLCMWEKCKADFLNRFHSLSSRARRCQRCPNGESNCALRGTPAGLTIETLPICGMVSCAKRDMEVGEASPDDKDKNDTSWQTYWRTNELSRDLRRCRTRLACIPSPRDVNGSIMDLGEATGAVFVGPFWPPVRSDRRMSELAPPPPQPPMQWLCREGHWGALCEVRTTERQQSEPISAAPCSEGMSRLDHRSAYLDTTERTTTSARAVIRPPRPLTCAPQGDGCQSCCWALCFWAWWLCAAARALPSGPSAASCSSCVDSAWPRYSSSWLRGIYGCPR